MYDGLDEHSPSKELIDTCWNVNIFLTGAIAKQYWN